MLEPPTFLIFYRLSKIMMLISIYYKILTKLIDHPKKLRGQKTIEALLAKK